ncbi:DinB family protein [Nocardioides limicola]|uniref:DinB family protein n=1 Tax=Nocardioides limicola TaxID=2803368 RepID=UPI001EEFF64E|nr:DinB family protein [Nocardioides sp. DJM-14]
MSEMPDWERDAKDWTWVLDQPCPECGYAAATVAPTEVAGAIRANAAAWGPPLAGANATRRPAPTIWSPTEYAAHVRDVHRVFGVRVGLMLAQDDPVFENWDQDATALEERYDRQRPAQVAAELVEAAEQVARQYDGVRGEAWQRGGTRSNGSGFTIASLARYHLHDVVHHLWDVSER